MSELPDAGQTVLIHVPGDAEPVWFGFWDGRRWHYIEGLPVRAEVRHWCGVPNPPSNVVPVTAEIRDAAAMAQEPAASEPLRTVA